MRPIPTVLLMLPLAAVAACSSGTATDNGSGGIAQSANADDSAQQDDGPSDQNRLISNEALAQAALARGPTTNGAEMTADGLPNPAPNPDDGGTAAPPVGASVGTRGTPFTGAGGLVRLTYPAPLTPGHDFGGKSLMSAGWRLSWDGTPVGPGTGVVSFAQDARPTHGPGSVTELIQIGLSRDPGVVAHCGTTGAKGGSGQRLPDRMLGGHRWTVWRNGDAGMSQAIAATDLRTVVDGVCYAIDRASYSVKAAPTPPATAPTQAAAAARMDAILASVRVGGRR